MTETERNGRRRRKGKKTEGQCTKGYVNVPVCVMGDGGGGGEVGDGPNKQEGCDPGELRWRGRQFRAHNEAAVTISPH